MQTRDDIELLRQYANENSEEAFATLVSRRMGMVYSVAFRCVGNAHLAEEVTQAVFILLARKAGTLRKDAISSWLFQTTRLTAANFVRAELRRHRREQEAYMESLEQQVPLEKEFSPLLDEALSKLATKDRHAVFLKFVEEKDCRQIAEVLGTSEEAARVRVRRAVDKLRVFMLRRGVAVSASAVAATIVANSAQAAPSHLAPSAVASMALKEAAVVSSTPVLMKAAMTALTWAKIKAGLVSAVLLLVAGGIVISMNRESNTFDASVWDSVDRSIDALRHLASTAVVQKSESEASGMPVTPVIVTGLMRGGTLQDVVCTPMKNADNAIGSIVMGVPHGLSKETKAIGKDLSARALLATAYGVKEFDLQTSLPADRYNYAVTVPEDPRGALQVEVQKALGVACHVEERTMNVLLLKVKKLSASGFVHCSHPSCQALSRELANLCWSLEEVLHTNVIDETGLAGGYHISSHLDYSQTRIAAEGESAKRAILEELGLELIPGQRKIPVLVVSPANGQKHAALRSN